MRDDIIATLDGDICAAVELFLGSAADTRGSVGVCSPTVPCSEKKASLMIKRKVHNEYVLSVMVYGSETWAPKKTHTELLSVEQCKMERIMLGITLRDHKRNTWIRHKTDLCKRYHRRYQEGNAWVGGTHCMIQRQQMGYKSDGVDTTRMDKTAEKTERQHHQRQWSN